MSGESKLNELGSESDVTMTEGEEQRWDGAGSPAWSARGKWSVGLAAFMGAASATMMIAKAVADVPAAAVAELQQGKLGSLQGETWTEKYETGCQDGFENLGTLFVLTSEQCHQACLEKSECEFVLFTPATSATPPTSAPTAALTGTPMVAPMSVTPATSGPSPSPSPSSSPSPSRSPSPSPSSARSTAAPTAAPTGAPTVTPTAAPTAAPTTTPTVASTSAPTAAPTSSPTAAPTAAPTGAPTVVPTAAPTAAPTSAPTAAPTSTPTVAPTAAPTAAPTSAPTVAPTCPPAAKVPPQGNGCYDGTELPSGKDGFTCARVVQHFGKAVCSQFAHEFDTDDFSVEDMCCPCGGCCQDGFEVPAGKNGLTCANVNMKDYCKPDPSNADDEDFTAMDMCCVCQGDQADRTPAPAQPAPAPPVPGSCTIGRGVCSGRPAAGTQLSYIMRAATTATGVQCGKGCSNWETIKLGSYFGSDIEACNAQCSANSDCAAFNVQVERCDGMPGKGTCYLFQAGCEVEDSPCWTLFTKQR